MSAHLLPEVQEQRVITVADLTRAEAALRASVIVRAMFMPALLPSQVAPPAAELPIDVQADEPQPANVLVIDAVACPETKPIEKSKPAVVPRQVGKVVSKELLQVNLPPRPQRVGRERLTEATLLSPNDVLPGYADHEPGSWQEKALCGQVDPELFFPEKGGTTGPGKEVCKECEVSKDCLKWALERDERFGIWGGYSERERRRIKRDGGIDSLSEHVAAYAHEDSARRIKLLVEVLEGNDSEAHPEIETTLVKDKQRLVAFIQAALDWFDAESPEPLGAAAYDRISGYFSGAPLDSIARTELKKERLNKALSKVVAFFDTLGENGADPLSYCWEYSAPEPTSLVS